MAGAVRSGRVAVARADHETGWAHVPPAKVGVASHIRAGRMAQDIPFPFRVPVCDLVAGGDAFPAVVTPPIPFCGERQTRNG